MLLVTCASYAAHGVASDWRQQVRDQVAQHQLDSALATIDRQLEVSPNDLEAHGWRGRILSWKGSWSEAESEYRYVLQSVPGDVDILIGLADVLLWSQRPQEALSVLDRARLWAPSNPEVLSRRAKVLRTLGRNADSQLEFRQLLAHDPHNQEAKRALKTVAPVSRHEFRVGEDIDTFNYSDAAYVHSLTLSSRWSQRWATSFSASFCQRFGESATKGTASAMFRVTQKDLLTVGGSGAGDQGIIPRSEAFFEYGHAFRLRNPFFRGLETSYRQHWLWYRGAHVLTTGVGQLVYLPRDWTWMFTTTGARSGFTGSGVEWVPSGSTKLGFPLLRQLSGNIFFAVGSENFTQVDQIGRFSAHTYGGGLRYRFRENQDVSGYIASQDRSGNRSQNSFGLSYGIHF